MTTNNGKGKEIVQPTAPTTSEDYEATMEKSTKSKKKRVAMEKVANPWKGTRRSWVRDHFDKIEKPIFESIDRKQ